MISIFATSLLFLATDSLSFIFSLSPVVRYLTFNAIITRGQGKKESFSTVKASL